MKKILVIALIASFLVPGYALAKKHSEEEMLEQCKSFAKEDEVSADEMPEYLKNCVEDLKEAAKDQ